MTSFVPLLGISAALLFALLLERFLPSQEANRPLRFLLVLLPFAAGGFYTYTALLTLPLLLLALLSEARSQGQLRFVWNLNFTAILVLTAAYCLTPLWAADKGTAPFGILRFLPLLPAALLLMQLSPHRKRACLDTVPFTGAFMTLFSCLCLLIPGADTYLTVNGRLAGFLQYPNTFATFLLAGLILITDKPTYARTDWALILVLIAGILLSGSKTALALLALTLLYLFLTRRTKKLLPVLVLFLILSAALALLLSNSNILHNTDRFLSNAETADSFLLRFIYWKDALRMIAKSPFGYGYGAYRALLCTFQTANYAVTFLHNGLLQLLFEIGWLPPLLLSFAFLRTLFSKNTPRTDRFLLFVISAHCMVDFNLQFSLFWLLILTCLDFRNGNVFSLRRRNVLSAVLCAFSLMLTFWLGFSDFFYNLGKNDLVLRLTPFHTDALNTLLLTTSDPETLDQTADKILSQNSAHSLAYSAKANLSLSQGDILSMISYKESAIRCNPYEIKEYTDYFDKLYAIAQLYLAENDQNSAAVCLQKLYTIQEMIESVNHSSDSVMQKIHGGFTLALPAKYSNTLQTLSQGTASTLPALGHSHTFTPWETVSIATCTQPGQQQRSCSCGSVQTKAYDALGHLYSDGICTRCADFEPGHSSPDNSRLHQIAGADRYGTSFLIANQLKRWWEIEKFDSIILANSDNTDALAASYLSAAKRAPILPVRSKFAARTVEYLNKHLSENAVIYILGSQTAVPDSILSGLTVSATAIRLTGTNLPQINLAALSQLPTTSTSLLIASSQPTAVTLAAAATGLPVLYVEDNLTQAQQTLIQSFSGDIYLSSECNHLQTTLESLIGHSTATFSTPEDISRQFFLHAVNSVIVSSEDLSGALCSIPLCAAANAPMLFGDSISSGYLQESHISAAYVLGFPEAIRADILQDLLEN